MNILWMRSELFVFTLPVVLWGIMGLVFNVSTRRFGKEAGYAQALRFGALFHTAWAASWL